MLGLGPKKASADDTALLRARVAALEDKVRALEAENRTIQGEWVEAHAQLMRQANRLRRYDAVDKTNPVAVEENAATGTHGALRALQIRRGRTSGIHP